jgi:hypothetical protein
MKKVSEAPADRTLQAFVEALLEVFETIPLLRTANKQGITVRMHTRVRSERFKEHLEPDDRFILDFLRTTAPPQKRGPSSLEPWITAIKSIFLLYLHSDEVGRDHKSGMRLLIDLVNAGWKEYCGSSAT